MTDHTRRVTHTFLPWLRDKWTSDDLVDMAGCICQVGDDNAWVCSWQLKVFFHTFHRLTTEVWSASVTRPLQIDIAIRLPSEVCDVAIPLFGNIIERVWQSGAAEGEHDRQEVENEKRRRITESLNSGLRDWHGRHGIEDGVAEAVMRLDPLVGYSALGDHRGPMALRLIQARVGQENERASAVRPSR